MKRFLCSFSRWKQERGGWSRQGLAGWAAGLGVVVMVLIGWAGVGGHWPRMSRRARQLSLRRRGR